MRTIVRVMHRAPEVTGRGTVLQDAVLRVLVAALGWWSCFEREASQLAPALPAALRGAGAIAAVGVAGVLLGCALECAFYVAWWRVRGARLPALRFYSALCALSLLDVLAAALAARASADPAFAPWIAPWIGWRAVGAHPFGPSGLSQVFGSFGLLGATRLVLNAREQARLLERPLRGTLALVAALWFAGHLISALTLDLLRGASPLD